MDISIQPVDNGWLVVDRTNITNRKRTVFTERHKMMEYLDDIIPPMASEQEFIDALDSNEEDDEGYISNEMIDSMLGEWVDETKNEV